MQTDVSNAKKRKLDGATICVFWLMLLSYAYFFQGGGPNQFSRFALTKSLAENGTVQIDKYHQLTIDKAVKDGHFYSDKAPGLSILAVPIYALVHLLLRLFLAFNARDLLNVSLYWTTLLTVAVPVAVAVAAFFSRVRRECGGAAAIWTTLALGLGSPLTVYASLFYGHALSAAFLFLAFLLVTRANKDADAEDQRPWIRCFFAGMLAGCGTLTEYPTVLITAILFVYICLRVRPIGKSAGAYVLGGLPLVIILLLYNKAAFGEFLANSYDYVYVPAFRDAMSEGIMGVTYPSWRALIGILFGSFRGLLFFWPFFVFCVIPATVILIDRWQLTSSTFLSLVIVVVFFIFGCSYFLWTGGASYGPRHLVPCFPFAAYLAAHAYKAIRPLFWGACVASVAIVQMSISTAAEFPAQCRSPLWQLVIPYFIRGKLSLKASLGEGRIGPFVLSQDDPRVYDAWNVGELLGLPGLWSLLPLVLAWCLLIGIVCLLMKRQDGA